MILYLIRHGKTIDHVNGIRQSFNSELHEESIRMLEDKSDFEQLNFSNVYSSPQKRATQTADILFKGHKIEVLDYIYEFVPPNLLNGLPREAGEKFWDEHRDEIYEPDWKFDGSESFNDIISRVQKFINFIIEHHKDEDTIAIVGHGLFFKHTIGYILAKERYSPIIFSDFLRLVTLKNGGYFVISIDSKNRSGSWLALNN